MPHPKDKKKSIGFLDVELYAEFFAKKRLGFCRFSEISGQLRKTKTGRFDAEKLAVTRKKLDHLKGKF